MAASLEQLMGRTNSSFTSLNTEKGYLRQSLITPLHHHHHHTAPPPPPSSTSSSKTLNHIKSRVIDRVQDQHSVIGRGFFKKETNFTVFLGLKVEASTGLLLLLNNQTIELNRRTDLLIIINLVRPPTLRQVKWECWRLHLAKRASTKCLFLVAFRKTPRPNSSSAIEL